MGGLGVGRRRVREQRVRGRRGGALVLVDTHAHGDALGAIAEAADVREDLPNGDPALVQVVDQLEEVVLGLHQVDLPLLAGKRFLADEIHLVLLVERVLLAGRLLTAHRGVRAGEQVAQARRDGDREQTFVHHGDFVQCNP